MGEEHDIKQIIPATDGWVAAFAEENDGEFYYSTAPVVCWALLITHYQGVYHSRHIPEVVGMAAFSFGVDNCEVIDNFIGYLAPGEDDKFVLERAREYFSEESDA